MSEDLLYVNTFNTWLLKKLVAEIPAEQFVQQPKGLPNHPAWVIGHLTLVRANFVNLLGGPGPVDPAVFAHCGGGSKPTCNAGDYKSKEELLTAFDAANDHLRKSIAEVKPDVWNGAPPEKFRARFPTIRNMAFALFTAHDAIHLGQLTEFRRATGLPGVL